MAEPMRSFDLLDPNVFSTNNNNESSTSFLSAEFSYFSENIKEKWIVIESQVVENKFRAMSDDSDYDGEPEEIDIYKRKYQLLAERCEVLQQDNERLVHRIQLTRKLLKRVKKEKKYLINRLDQHGDRWREAPMGVLEENSVFPIVPKQEKSSKAIVNNVKEEKPKKGTKRKGAKTDPNAPKRPANPFFQFCQEQRPRVMERLAGEPEPSKQELTRQLATTWKSLSSEDKKVYYDMYERSKEKYVAEMQVYNKKSEDGSSQMSMNVP